MSTNEWLFFWAAFYLVLLSAATALAIRRKGSAEDFFNTTSHPVGRFALVMTFVATLFSAFFVVGLPGFIFTHGLVAWPYVIVGDVFGCFALYYVGKKIHERHVASVGPVISPIELISDSRLFAVTLSLAMAIFIVPYLAVQISGVGRLLEAVTGGAVPLFQGAAATLAVIWLYSTIGGVRSVIYTDAVQGVILLTITLAVGLFVAFVLFSSPIELFQKIQTTHAGHLQAPGGKGAFPYPILFSYFFIFAALMISQPQFLTRYILLKKDVGPRYLRFTALSMAAILAIMTLPVIFIGLGGKLLYPDLTSGDQVFGKLVQDHLPNWFAALTVIAVLSASMSTADSILFSLSQIFTRDIYQRNIETTNQQTVPLLIGRFFVLIVALAAFVVGVSSSDLIVQLASMSFSAMICLAPAIVGHLWWPSAWKHSGAISILTGLTFYLLFRFGNGPNLMGLDVGILATAWAAAVFVILAPIKERKA